jgi:hypothetical protein
MRVIVNRVWKAHFGTGIVDSPSNFGFGGERPTDPELLEYLANYFVGNGMSIKKLQRKIMLSSVYQLSTADDKIASDKDSGNRLYWRANRKRMDAEQVRDSILEISGKLDDQLGGPSKELTPDYTRRTVYGQVSRYKLDSYLQLFDFPPPNISAEKRFTTTVPVQRLFLMNSDFVQLEAEALAKRVAAEPDNRARITRLYEIVYGRPAKEQEIQIGLDYLRTEPMKEYEEDKTKPKDTPGGRGRGRRGAGGDAKDADKPATTTDAAPGNKPATDAAKPPMPDKTEQKAETASAETVPSADTQTPEADPNGGMGMGMMAGVPGFGGFGNRRGNGPPKPVEVKYDPTVWGRYAKILISSSEFIFIN